MWSRDPDSEREWKELSKPGNCFDGEKRKDWTPWQSEIEALAIVGFEQVKGHAYLGGTWEKAGDKPHESNPEISGYENQMTIEALEELQKLVGKEEADRLKIHEALAECKSIARQNYEAQMAEKPAK